MITWGPCGHPLRVVNAVVPSLACRVCWLLALPENIGTTRAHGRAEGQPNPVHVENANAWAGGDVGSHLTVEQMRAIELGQRRGCNRGTRYENVDRIRMDGHYTRMELYPLHLTFEVEDTVRRICPPQSRRPAWLINWMLAQRQKHLVERALLVAKGSGVDISTAADLYDVFGVGER